MHWSRHKSFSLGLSSCFWAENSHSLFCCLPEGALFFLGENKKGKKLPLQSCVPSQKSCDFQTKVSLTVHTLRCLQVDYCPGEFQLSASGCFYLEMTQPMSWDDAKRSCQETSGHNHQSFLAEPTTAGVNLQCFI